MLLDADSVIFFNTSACNALLNTMSGLQCQGITVAFARVRDEVPERLRLAGIKALVGSANFRDRVTGGVRAPEYSRKA